MEAKALEAEGRIVRSSSKEDALKNAILATEIYMKAIKLASGEAERAKLKKKCLSALAKAEEIKQLKVWNMSVNHVEQPPRREVPVFPISNRTPSTREKVILLEGSKLHGLLFPPWTSEPSEDFFNVTDGKLYLDASEINLSDSQQKVFAGWKRPDELFHRRWKAGDGMEITSVPTMVANENIDLVQDVTADCSVVASLCSAVARTENGFEKLMRTIVYPYDEENSRPLLSHNGRYVFRFHFNGCFRRVVIDDRLPDSVSSRTLHVVDRQNPGLLWPALLEKAYLKVRGGYDFPGSNSGTDLWVLTGWIPEQVFLQSNEIEPQELWQRIFRAYGFGDVVITIGTGRLSQREEEGLGLAGEHDYAVLSMKEAGGKRLVLVKNPWCNGTIWKGGNHNVPESFIYTQSGDKNSRNIIPDKLIMAPGTFWITFDEIIHNFESLYLNWNPGLFRHRQDHHFAWTVPLFMPQACFAHNPQYTIRSEKGGPVWILLSRHFSTEESDIQRRSQENQKAALSSLGFIGLYVFRTEGERVHLSDNALLRGPFVDSPQTLARFEAHSMSTYTIVVAQQELPLPQYSFTISTFSRQPVSMELATNPYTYCEIVSGAWTTRTAGGNASASTYPANPQFSIAVASPTDLTILLETNRVELAIHVELVWANGYRVTAVSAKDIISDSGEYRRGCALTKVSKLPIGTYTIICSTFESGQSGDFRLQVESMVPCVIKPIAHEAAGRISLRLPLLIMLEGTDRILAPVKVSRMTRVRVVAGYKRCDSNNENCSNARPLLKISLERGQGPHKTILATSCSGTFSDSPAGVRIQDFDINPDLERLGGVWLVVERFGGRQMSDEIEVELLSEAAVEVGAWGTGNG